MVVSVAKRVANDPPEEEPQPVLPSMRDDRPTRGELDDTIKKHLPALEARARRLCRGHVDAEDVVQEALLRAYETRSHLRDLTRARAWLLAIVHSTFVDRIRRERRRGTVPLVDPTSVVDEPTQRLPWEDISDDDVRAAIDRLPADVRVTYSMFALEGRSYATIAARQNIPSATVGTRVHRARKHLRLLLASRLEKSP
jgi:RNA polymerase sigma-70 factor, ECF subfamily